MDNKIFESLEDILLEVQRELWIRWEWKERESFIVVHLATETVELQNKKGK